MVLPYQRLGFSRGGLMITQAAVGCKPLILIQPSPCSYSLWVGYSRG